MAFIEDLGKAIVGNIFTNYFFGGVTTVVAASILSKTMKVSGRSYLVGVTKEAISFKQWFSSEMAETKEFWEDITAEAKHQYKSEVDKRLEILQKQQQILQKIKTTL